MHTLISPREVVEIAFAGSEPLNESSVGETVIMTAEQKFIRPVLGNLYDSLLNNLYPELLDEYIKAPLALYVKLLVLPSMAVHTGTMGIVQHHSKNMETSSRSQQSALESQTRASAMSLIKRAITHIELNPTRYPEYDGSQNILNKTSIEGHIVL